MHDHTSLAQALDAQWRRCRRYARSLAILEAVQAGLAIGVLVVVALCGIVAITHVAVATGAVALPLGLGLAVSLALALFGLALRARASHEIVRQEMFRLDCARRGARERERATPAGPYRTGASLGDVSPASCTRCLLETPWPIAARDARSDGVT
jgi:hypothetical protein